MGDGTDPGSAKEGPKAAAVLKEKGAVGSEFDSGMVEYAFLPINTCDRIRGSQFQLIAF